MRTLWAAMIAAVIAWSGPASAESAHASIKGHLRSHIEGLSLSDAVPIIVFLEPKDADFSFSLPDETPLIRQAGARFEPRFLVVTVGQRVELRNDDSIYHNVFSYSQPNDFDLGVYPEGESKFKTFETPGLVRLYCSIHDPMNGVIFVAPSPYFDVVGADGVFRIASIKKGTYRLRTFSARLPEQGQEIHLAPGEHLQLEMGIEEQRGPPSRRVDP